MLRTIREDIQSVLKRDPAATGKRSVLLNYPGLHAVWMHHANHWLWLRGYLLMTRCLSQLARFRRELRFIPVQSSARWRLSAMT